MPTETDPNATAAPEIPVGNPGGYQPGDPNAPVDLPPQPDMSSPSGILVGDLPPPTEALAPAEAPNPAVAAIPAPVLGALPPLVPPPSPPSDVPVGNFAGGVTGEAAPVEVPLSPQTLAELEAGRAAVERARSAVMEAKARAEEGNAERMRQNGPADEGDLSYNTPQG